MAIENFKLPDFTMTALCAVIGEIAAALLDGKTARFDLSLFAPDRFRGPEGDERANFELEVKKVSDGGRS